MPRSPVVRCLVFGTLAVAFWLGRGLLPSAPEPSDVAAPEQIPERAEKATPPRDLASTPPPPDTVFTLSGSEQPFAIALDELYFPQRPAATRLASVPRQAGLVSLLAYAAALPAPAPRLVLYPVDGPRNLATRRILNPGLEVALASAAVPTPAPRPDLGIVAWERPAYASDHAIARIVGDPAQPLRSAAALARLPGIVSVRPLLARQHSRKFVPNDPLFKDQWHLRNTGQQSGKAGIDIRAVPAWDTATGTGVTIGIVDDGLDYYHPDLAPAYNAALGHDWDDNDEDPAPVAGGPEGDNHGTAVAGLAAARGNNFIGIDGVAPSATLAGLRLIAAETDDAQDAGAMAWRNDAIQVKNNSWGPPDASSYEKISPDLYPAEPLWRAAVADAIATGRGGLGTLFFWASGNGQADGDQGAKDGYSSLRLVIPVAAVTNKGAIAVFSEGGPHLVVTAPGDAKIGLVTTDRPGDGGYNTSTGSYPGDYFDEIDYTKSFSGTSAATPIASGVGALLLQLRPDLGWRDVKEILLRSSTKLLPTSGDWVTRPAGDTAHPIKHHPRLGGGLLNALDALNLARDWQPLGAEQSLTTGPLYPAKSKPDGLPLSAPIPDAGKALLIRTPAFAGPRDTSAENPVMLRVEHVELTVDITHPYRGDLEIKLTSPGGTTSVFTVPTKADAGANYKNAEGTAGYTFSSVRHWGEPSSGVWTISVRDAYKKDVGTLHSATLTLYGTALIAPVVVSEPEAQTLTTGSTLVLGAAFSGGNLSLQWTRDGKPIKGATAPAYSLANFSAKTAGQYACVATNPAGVTSTTPVAIRVDDTPALTFAGHAGAVQSFDLNTFLGLLPSDSYTVGALPPGLKFDRTTGLLTGAARQAGAWKVAFTFTRDGLATRLYLGVNIAAGYPEQAGNYVGWFNAISPAYNRGLGGLVTVTLQPDGRYTGQVRYGDWLYPLSGRLKNSVDEGAQTATVKLAAKKNTPVLNLLLYSSEGGYIQCLLRPPGSTEDGGIAFAYQDTWSASNPTPYAGDYLLTAETSLPTGANRLRLLVAPSGTVTWELCRPDDTVLQTGSSRIGKEGSIQLYGTTLTPAGETFGNVSLYHSADRSFASLNWMPVTPATSADVGTSVQFQGYLVP